MGLVNLVCNKKSGFTLSEVMVVLTMIGVVATLTLSTVGASIQQRARLAEFRTAYSKMESALKGISIDEGQILDCYEIPDETERTTYGLTFNGEPTAGNQRCETEMDNFARAMGATRYCKTDPIKEGCIPENYPTAEGCFTSFDGGTVAYVLDNSMILLSDNSKALKQFAVDVNGRKGPNIWGQDIFTFSVKATSTTTSNGTVYVTDFGILPPTECLPGKGVGSGKGASRSSDEMLKESVNFKN